MKIELYIHEKEFIIRLLRNTSVQRILDKLQKSSTVHPDNEEFVECELTTSEVNELVGELSYEVNHNRKRHVAEQANEIAEALESQMRGVT